MPAKKTAKPPTACKRCGLPFEPNCPPVECGHCDCLTLCEPCAEDHACCLTDEELKAANAADDALGTVLVKKDCGSHSGTTSGPCHKCALFDRHALNPKLQAGLQAGGTPAVALLGDPK